MRSRALESTVIGQITARNVPDTKSVVAQLGGIRYSVAFVVTFILLYAIPNFGSSCYFMLYRCVSLY